MTSILIDIKKLLGLSETYDQFDSEIIIGINAALNILTQIGLGPKEGFFITGEDENWNDFLGQYSNLELVKSYVYLKTRIFFDPPSSSIVMDSMKQMISEYEWRISVTVDR